LTASQIAERVNYLVAHMKTPRAHVHTPGAHAHTPGAHVHTPGAHVHTAGAHLHTAAAHVHTLGAHAPSPRLRKAAGMPLSDPPFGTIAIPSERA
jgi:hypothetical protein